MFKELIELADNLDRRGLRKEADYLDRIIEAIASFGPITKLAIETQVLDELENKFDKTRLPRSKSDRKSWERQVLPYVQKMIKNWSSKLPGIQIELDGSLADGTFDARSAIDVDIQMALNYDEDLEYIKDLIFKATGLKYDHEMRAGSLFKKDVEGIFPVPLEISAVLSRRERRYSISELFNKLLTPAEKEEYQAMKRMLERDRAAYPDVSDKEFSIIVKEEYREYKQRMIQEVADRALKKGLISEEERFYDF